MSIEDLLIGASLGILGCILLPHTEQAPSAVHREGVTTGSSIHAALDMPPAPDAPTSDANTADEQEAVSTSAVSFSQETTEAAQVGRLQDDPEPGVTRRDTWDTSRDADPKDSGRSLSHYTQPQPSVTFNCPTCKGAGIYYGALCPTCDGASAATLTKDGVTFSEQGWKQPAPTPPPVPAYPVRAAVSGRWIQVPTYGPLGRQRGFRWQWQPYQAPRQYQYQTRYYMNSCPTGTCGR